MDARATIDAYDAAAGALVSRFEAIPSERVLAPVLDQLPIRPCRILDVGAGTGRDAAWLAGRGHSVLAMEPVAGLRDAGRALHRSPRIEWLDDALPKLARVTARGEVFDLILLSAVWQHLDTEARATATPILTGLLAPEGKLILSLRHGPGAPDRPVFACPPEETIRQAGLAGLTVRHRAEATSIQPENVANGVRWTWLVLGR